MGWRVDWCTVTRGQKSAHPTNLQMVSSIIKNKPSRVGNLLPTRDYDEIPAWADPKMDKHY